jgi:hypothetical protein
MKIIKWISITLAALISLVVIAASIVIWFVFTPEKLTPIVRKQANNYLTCTSQIEKVELTFFSTFPLFGLKVNGFMLVNPVNKAISDTLIKVESVTATLDVKAWWNNNDVVIKGFIVKNGTINAFVDSLGITNFNIVKPDTLTETPVDTSKTNFYNLLDIGNIEFENINISYVDLKGKMQTSIKNLSATLNAKIKAENIESKLEVSNSIVSFTMGNSCFLNNATIKFGITSHVNMAKQSVNFNHAYFDINNLRIDLNGSIENDTLNKQLHTNIQYELNSWSIPNVLALVPAGFQSYLKGLKFDGEFSSNGTVSGIYSATSMPLLDIKLQLNNASLQYAGVPLPLSKMNGNFELYTDLKNDNISIFRINEFSAKTPNSQFITKGIVKNFFTDIYCNLTTNGRFDLGEFNPFIPVNLKTKISGIATGELKTAFTMSQMLKVQLDKMKISATTTLANFEATYDTIRVKALAASANFSYPTPKATLPTTSYFWTKINAANFEASAKGGIFANAPNMYFELETSNFMDTTKIADVFTSFSADVFTAGTDSLYFTAQNPIGNLSLISQKGSKAFPAIKFNYKSGVSQSALGANKLSFNSISLNTEVNNDPLQKLVYEQWKAKGYLNLDNATISVSAIPYPIEIPSIKMNFDPDNFNIKESKLIIGKSDFKLSGVLSNITSYIRKDSLLRANFTFASNNTDLLELMALTSGFGAEPDTTIAQNTPATSGKTSETAGPYFVPKGIDFMLKSNVKKATFAADTITNISGNVIIKDGILVLDDLFLTTPATKIQLTSMYRTPRKNHLYLGIDYHMLDIEIDKLLTMIPNIDSMMPMLKAFKGKGEFHIAAETYLDSMYNVKNSTIRAASSIKGKDLVLMDGPQFAQISKILMFNKKTRNNIDSLSVEFTIFKNEIDIYPFIIGIDKYKAVISGRHNLDMSFDYNVSLVESPVPFKLGAEVSGDLNNLKYSLAKCKFAEFYRPTSRNVVETKQIQLRKLIRDALLKKVNTKVKLTENETIE